MLTYEELLKKTEGTNRVKLDSIFEKILSKEEVKKIELERKNFENKIVKLTPEESEHKQIPIENLFLGSWNEKKNRNWLRTLYQHFESEYKKQLYNQDDVNLHIIDATEFYFLTEMSYWITKSKYSITEFIDDGQEKKATVLMKDIKDDIRNIVIEPLRYGLQKTDVTHIKNSWERLEEHFNYKANVYQFYPDIIQKDFYEKLYKKKEFYMNRQVSIKIDKEEDIQKKLCPGENTNFKLQTHQKFMKSYLSVNTPFNGLLIFHGTGSGKTCSSITIAESYKNLIALSSKKILVILAKSVKSNFIKEIHDISRGYNQCTSSEYLNYDYFTNTDKKKKNVLSLIDKFYDLVTFGTFRNTINKKLTKHKIKYDINIPLPTELVNWIDLMFSDKVIIVDEVHNLKKYIDDHGQDLEKELLDIPESDNNNTEIDSVSDDLDILKDDDYNEDLDTSYFKPYHALELILKYAQNVKLILLSATPMYHTPTEIVSILNLLLVNDKYARIDPKNIFNGLELTEKGEDILRVTSQGYVSYLRTETPHTFAKRNYKNSVAIHEFVNKKLNILNKKYDINEDIMNDDYLNPFKIVPCPMSTLHQQFYTTSLKAQISLSKIIEYGNIAKDNPDAISENQLNLNNLLDPENSISSKLGALVRNLLNNISNGTNFAYSWYVSSGTSILARALLENGVQMAMYSRSERKISAADPKYIKHILGGKKIYKQPEQSKLLGYDGKTREQWKKEDRILNFKPMKFAYIIGKIEEDERDNLINSFNLDANKDGSIIKIMVGSGVFKEGISLKNVRQVHLLEPWHNRSRIEQVIGRALRHCSHQKLPPKDRQVDIYQYAITYKNMDDIASGTKSFLRQTLKYFTEPIIKNPKVITGEFAKTGIFSYDIIMYMRSQILHNLVLDVKHVLQETAIDCIFNREINVNTLKEEDQYDCFKSLKHLKNGDNMIEYFEKKDYNIHEEELDYSTFDEFFYEPYIVFVINVIKKSFEIERTTYTITFKQILENPILDDPIYFEKNNFIIRSALYRLIPKYYSDLRTFPHVIQKKIGRNRIYGYIFGRETTNGGLFIFQPFEDQDFMKTSSKKILRSDFERSPMYEKTEFENLSSIPMAFNSISPNLRNKYDEIIKSKKKGNRSNIIPILSKHGKKILNANELIKERDISLNDEKEANKNAPLIGLILDVTSLSKMPLDNLWGEKGFHLWLREKVMICKTGKRSSIGQLATSFSVSNFQCMFKDYIFKNKFSVKEIIKMMKATKNKRAIIFAEDIQRYSTLEAWFDERSIKNNRSKTSPALKKLDYANIIYLLFKLFEKDKTNNNIWIRRLYD